jgi:hypothetical protein
MNQTVSQTVHEAVERSKSALQPLDIHDSALKIADRHGIGRNGLWLVEQALMMVGSRAGVGMKIGKAPPPRPRHTPPLRAAGSD